MIIKKIDRETLVKNKYGAIQSDVPMALHLIDPSFVITSLENQTNSLNEKAILNIYYYMKYNNTEYLYKALYCLAKDFFEILYVIGCVLKEGETKYPLNNWRYIPREQHLNHALNHLYSSITGDTQEDHTAHALCRLMMSIATKETQGFNYTLHIESNFSDSLWT